MALTLLVGCEVPELDIPETKEDRQVQLQKEKERKERETADIAEETPDVPSDTEPVTEEPREFVAKDGKKGKKSREAGGYLGAVGSARFVAEHRMIINSYTHALNLYWGENGYYPKTHEEFMEKIIKFNKLQLPELDEGVEYLYDPEDHLLKIHRPSADAKDVSSEAGS